MLINLTFNGYIKFIGYVYHDLLNHIPIAGGIVSVLNKSFLVTQLSRPGAATQTSFGLHDYWLHNSKEMTIIEYYVLITCHCA
jgi:hypothetical protein